MDQEEVGRRVAGGREKTGHNGLEDCGSGVMVGNGTLEGHGYRTETRCQLGRRSGPTNRGC